MSIQSFLTESVSKEAQKRLTDITRKSLYINGEYIISKTDLSIVQSKILEMNKRIIKLKEKNRIPIDAPEMEISISLLKENPFKKDKEIINVKIGNSKLEDNNPEIDSLKRIFNKIEDLSSFVSIKLNTEKLTQLTEWIILGLVSKMENSEAYTLSTFTDEPLPDKYKDINNTNPCLCEHCQTNRARNNTFILKNEKTEEILQVGASCMKSFVDEKTLKYFFSINYNNLFINDEDYGGSYKYIPVFDKEEYLATVSASIKRTGGYKSRKSIEDDSRELTTNQLVMYNLDDQLLSNHLMNLSLSLNKDLSTYQRKEILEREKNKIIDLDVTDEDKEIAKKTIEFQRNKTKEEVLKLNEFEFNMYSILNDDTDILIGTAAPRVAYSVPIYLKMENALNKQALIDKLNSESTYEVPTYFALEKQKFEQLELKFVSYKYNYDEWYRSDNYIMYFKTLSGQDVYIKHSGAMDSLPLDFLDEDNMLKPAEVITSEYAGKYITLRGSVTENTRLKTDKGNLIIRTKIGRIKMAEHFTDEPISNGAIVLNEKFSIGDFKVINKEQSSIILNKDIVPNYKYTFEDKSGKQYSVISSHEFEAFEKDKNVRMIFQQGYQDLILPTKKESIKVIPELEIDVTNNLTEKGVVKIFSPKEVKKKVKPS